MAELTVAVQLIAGCEDIPLPAYESEGAAGLDLRAAVSDSVTLLPGARALIPTGIAISIPAGYEGQVRARSGLAWKKGLGMVNAPGTIDSDYRGEIQVILINWSSEPQTISRGDRIAQLVVAPVVRVELLQVERLDSTLRGGGGFGHTGS